VALAARFFFPAFFPPFPWLVRANFFSMPEPGSFVYPSIVHVAFRIKGPDRVALSVFSPFPMVAEQILLLLMFPPPSFVLIFIGYSRLVFRLHLRLVRSRHPFFHFFEFPFFLSFPQRAVCPISRVSEFVSCSFFFPNRSSLVNEGRNPSHAVAHNSIEFSFLCPILSFFSPAPTVFPPKV